MDVPDPPAVSSLVKAARYTLNSVNMSIAFVPLLIPVTSRGYISDIFYNKLGRALCWKVPSPIVPCKLCHVRRALDPFAGLEKERKRSSCQPIDVLLCDG